MGSRYMVALALIALTLSLIEVVEGSEAQVDLTCSPILATKAQNQPRTRLDYNQLMTRPFVEVRQVKVLLSQGVHIFEVHVQTEWERRINLPSDKRKPEFHASEILNYFYGTQFKELNHGAAGRLKLPEYWQGRFQLAPLTNEEENLFSLASAPTVGRRVLQPLSQVQVEAVDSSRDSEEPLIQEVTGSRLFFKPLPKTLRDQFGPDWSDSFQARYLVVSQDETGTYYDTVNGELERQNIAVRLKTRQRPNATADQAVHRSLTIKVNSDEEAGFTRRQEVQATWPKGLPLQEAPVAIRQILKTVLKTDLGKSELLAQREVNNTRVAFRLEDIKGGVAQKVGFVTVDQFQVKDLLTGASRTGTPVTQLEIELLAQVAPALLRDPSALEGISQLIQSIETRLGGQHTVEAKYRQTSP